MDHDWLLVIHNLANNTLHRSRFLERMQPRDAPITGKRPGSRPLKFISSFMEKLPSDPLCNSLEATRHHYHVADIPLLIHDKQQQRSNAVSAVELLIVYSILPVVFTRWIRHRDLPFTLATLRAISHPQTWFYDAAPRHTTPPPEAHAVCKSMHIGKGASSLALRLCNVIYHIMYLCRPPSQS